MSYRHEDLVDQNSKATGLALGLLKKIARHVDDRNPGNYAYVSYRKLARAIGIREEENRWPKEIEREQMMPQLFDLGEIECAPEGGPYRTNLYFLLEPIMGPAHPAWPQDKYPRYDDEEESPPAAETEKPKRRSRKAKAKEVEPEVEPEVEEWRCTCDVPRGTHSSGSECKVWRAEDMKASLALEKAQAQKDGKERQAQEELYILQQTRAEINASRQSADEAADYGYDDDDDDEERQLEQNRLDEEEDEERWARQEAEEEAAGKVPAVVEEEDDDDDI